MTVLQVADLRFGYAGDTLFEGVTFSLAIGERAALVAPNGAGKSTLLRIIAKDLEPDGGSSVIKREASFAYYRQSHEVKADGDVLGAFMSGYSDVVALRAELSQAQHDAASGEERALEHLSRLTDQYHLARGDELEREVGMLAQKLGFTERDLSRPVASLSGGERGRLTLGVVLALKADLLLIDEPTNHLDLDTIAWLENYLVSYRGAVLVVSHDRAFLDNVCPRTFELGSKGLRIYPLKYSDYAVARQEDLARERGLVDRQKSMIDKTEDFIRKNIAGQKTKQAQSRRKMLDKLDRLAGPEDVWQVAERVAFRFAPAARSGDIVLDVRNVGAERAGRVLFENFEMLIRRGERIGIVGPNGAGKTTLLKILAGRGMAGDRGDIKRGTNLQEGYFDQQLGELNPQLLAVDEVRRVRGDFTVEAARQYLARFRFWGDDPLRRVSGFSGGECSRLALAKLLLEPRNILFLDEPTNHLDIPAAEILEEALTGFDGTVILVSHDRRFLETITTRLVSVRDGRVDIYSGGFKDFATRLVPKIEEEQPKRKTVPPPPKPEEKKPSVSDAQRAREASKEKERKKRRVDELEKMIASAEKELEDMRAKLQEDPAGNWAKVAAMATAEQALTKKVDAMMSEWAKLSESRE